MKIAFELLYVLAIRLAVLPAFMTIIYNKIAWEFNLPNFPFGFFVLIELLIISKKMLNVVKTDD